MFSLMKNISEILFNCQVLIIIDKKQICIVASILLLRNSFNLLIRAWSGWTIKQKIAENIDLRHVLYCWSISSIIKLFQYENQINPFNFDFICKGRHLKKQLSVISRQTCKWSLDVIDIINLNDNLNWILTDNIHFIHLPKTYFSAVFSYSFSLFYFRDPLKIEKLRNLLIFLQKLSFLELLLCFIFEKTFNLHLFI